MVVWLLRRVSPTQQRPARKASSTSAPHRSSHLIMMMMMRTKNIPVVFMIFLYTAILSIVWYLEMFCFEHCMISGDILLWRFYNILKCFVLKANYGFLSVDWESRSLKMGVRSDYFQTSINIYQIIRSYWILFFFKYQNLTFTMGVRSDYCSDICHISILSEQNVVRHKSYWIWFFFKYQIQIVCLIPWWSCYF